jgi:hypothetical protein
LKDKGGASYPDITINIEMVKTAMNSEPFDKAKAGEGLINTIKILSHIMNGQ